MPDPRWSPQAQRTLASGRADRARPAVSAMLGVRTAAVKRQQAANDPPGSAGMTPRGTGTAAATPLEDQITA
jgi:hypothetical protein